MGIEYIADCPQSTEEYVHYLALQYFLFHVRSYFLSATPFFLFLSMPRLPIFTLSFCPSSFSSLTSSRYFQQYTEYAEEIGHTYFKT